MEAPKPFYIEISHDFNGACTHEVLVHRNLDDCKYSHCKMQVCNSDEYYELDAGAGNEADLFMCSDIAAEWLVFEFYENQVIDAFVFLDEAKARAKFDQVAETIQPYDKAIIKVTECNDMGEMMCGLYIKSLGYFVMPDKVKRVIIVKIPEIGNSVRI